MKLMEKNIGSSGGQYLSVGQRYGHLKANGRNVLSTAVLFSLPAFCSIQLAHSPITPAILKLLFSQIHIISAMSMLLIPVMFICRFRFFVPAIITTAPETAAAICAIGFALAISMLLISVLICVSLEFVVPLMFMLSLETSQMFVSCAMGAQMDIHCVGIEELPSSSTALTEAARAIAAKIEMECIVQGQNYDIDA
jgi:hypothetical protein